MCGVNGETFASQCHAHGSFIAVDYSEPCNSIPRENGRKKEVLHILMELKYHTPSWCIAMLI